MEEKLYTWKDEERYGSECSYGVWSLIHRIIVLNLKFVFQQTRGILVNMYNFNMQMVQDSLGGSFVSNSCLRSELQLC